MCSAVLCYHVPFFLLLPFRLKLDLYAPYCPLFRLNLVVYLVCTKLLSELLSIWFLRSSDNTVGFRSNRHPSVTVTSLTKFLVRHLT